MFSMERSRSTTVHTQHPNREFPQLGVVLSTTTGHSPWALRYIATIDDPGAYTKTWSGGWAIPWNPNDEMYEYVCQENNRDARHMYRGEQ